MDAEILIGQVSFQQRADIYNYTDKTTLLFQQKNADEIITNCYHEIKLLFSFSVILLKETSNSSTNLQVCRTQFGTPINVEYHLFKKQERIFHLTTVFDIEYIM